MIDPFKDYIDIGYVQRAHGTNGNLILDLKFNILELRSFIVEVEGSKIPFLVEECFISDQKAYIKIFGIGSISDCEFIKGEKIFADKSTIQKEEIFFHEMIGYKVMDIREGFLGRVKDIKHMPMQRMIFVDRAGEELLIPYHKDIIIEVDHIKKEIVSALPHEFL